MDRGRIIDQISNTNARFLLDYEDKKTSKNICQPPGGKSSFSLAWGMPDQDSSKKQSNQNFDLHNNYKQNNNNMNINNKVNNNDILNNNYNQHFDINNNYNKNNINNNKNYFSHFNIFF